MKNLNPVLVMTTRGPLVENRHCAAAAVFRSDGTAVECWGDTASPILPRSAVKMIQALPLVESGAADAYRLSAENLALSCASHEGAPIHTDRVGAWLTGLDLSADNLLCGPQPPRDKAMKKARVPASRILNNCSGKHAGFLTYTLHSRAPVDGYLDPTGTVQSAIGQAFAEVTGTQGPLAYGIDGCSAPNFIASLEGVARAMALFADPSSLGQTRAAAMLRLRDAMRAHPLLISGEGRACAALITATEGRAIVKTGADGVYTGIVPESGIGFCLKVDDGNRIASEALCAALLIRLGVLDPAHPTAIHYAAAPIRNFNDEVTGGWQVTLD